MALLQNIDLPNGTSITYWVIQKQSFNADGSVQANVAGYASVDAFQAGDVPMMVEDVVLVDSPTPEVPADGKNPSIPAVPVAYTYTGDISTVLDQSYSLLAQKDKFSGGGVVPDVPVITPAPILAEPPLPAPQVKA